MTSFTLKECGLHKYQPAYTLIKIGIIPEIPKRSNRFINWHCYLPNIILSIPHPHQTQTGSFFVAAVSIALLVPLYAVYRSSIVLLPHLPACPAVGRPAFLHYAPPLLA